MDLRHATGPARAIVASRDLDPAAAARTSRTNFSADKMALAYAAAYRRAIRDPDTAG
jgi:hypothetical protein